ncbi:MAG: hypothetical protein ACKOAY_06225 [Haliscomenobacter sp.]
MLTRTAQNLALLLLANFLLLHCSSPAKLVETGSYDTAIQLAVQKLAGKEKKKAIHVQALQEAFTKATQRDMDRAEKLKASGRPEDWEQVYEIYRVIEDRQARIEPLLPLVDENGKKASFRFVHTDELTREAREEAAAFLYRDAQRLMELARNHRDRPAAREALSQLDKISRYYRVYQDRDALMNEARILATTFVLVELQNRAPVILPAGLEEELLQLGFGNQQGQWRVFHSRPQEGIQYDYRASYLLLNIQSSPGTVSERQYEESREIEDGFNYVLDEKGNVKKDTAGNDIKVPKKVLIKALVLENYQSKAARIAGRLELYDFRTHSIIDIQDLGAEAIFENYAATFRGDERALSAETRKRIGNRPQPFPSDEFLILEAARRLKPILLDKLERTSLLR